MIDDLLDGVGEVVGEVVGGVVSGVVELGGEVVGGALDLVGDILDGADSAASPEEDEEARGQRQGSNKALRLPEDFAQHRGAARRLTARSFQPVLVFAGLDHLAVELRIALLRLRPERYNALRLCDRSDKTSVSKTRRN